MTVNGVARWTCRTHVGAVGGEGRTLQIAPLANLRGYTGPCHRHARVLQQVDAQKAITKARARGATTLRPWNRSARKQQALQAGIECIGCGVCYASCDVVGWRSDYLVARGRW